MNTHNSIKELLSLKEIQISSELTPTEIVSLLEYVSTERWNNLKFC